MNFYQLGQNGFGNPFYATGVRSMGDSLHNFFFVSYDPGGFVTLDKPPLGFWLQVISSKIFGFTPFSVYFPQALAGVLSVWLLYVLVRRHFGVVAGLLAALALAISPISVITNRNNTIDSTLALTMLVGAWAVIRAAETGKLRWLLLCAALVGIGFNIKMAEAYLVIPAFGALYLLAAPRTIWTRIWHLALALLVMLTISLSWVVIVDLTPTSMRPYVDSTQDNSELSLAVGYNGIDRLLGNIFGGRRAAGTTNGRSGQANTPPTGTPPSGGAGDGTRRGTNRDGANGQFSQVDGGGTFNTGAAGPLRLFDEPLGGQIVWLLPIALLGMLALAWQQRFRFKEDVQQKSLILWGVWLLTMGVFFSVAGFFHQYYMTMMAPAICALFGIGVVVMWNDYRQHGWRGWLLPLALLATALEQIHIIMSNPAWGTWLIPLIAIPCFLVALVLIVARLFPRMLARFNNSEGRTRYTLQGVLAIALIALMLTPAVWSTISVLQNTESQIPTAGPSGTGGFGGGRADNATSTNTALISYLEAHQGNAKYLVAVPSSMVGDSIILATNKPVMSLGGFSGSDPILTKDQLASLVTNGTVRYFLLNGGGFSGRGQGSFLEDLPPAIRERIEEGGFGGGGFGGGAFGGGTQSSLSSWVTQNCSAVPSSQWQSSTSSTQNPGRSFGAGAAGSLYDCASAK
jgi:4-amino-4-deoxy-L-arabinose transferase-like glycosyltransferase